MDLAGPAAMAEAPCSRPASSSSSAAAPPPGPGTPAGGDSRLFISTGEINEFQMYQKFRLRMVQAFGSISSALYEFGADPETGRISRADFVQVCCTKLDILSTVEANVLFSHITNADPLDCGLGGVATHRNFGIQDEEWRSLVQQKQQAANGGPGSMPFQSGPSGANMGTYFRPIRLGNLTEQQKPSRIHANLDGSGEMTMEVSVRDSAAAKRTPRTYPWRQRQQPWAPSTLRGTGGLEAVAKASLLSRSRAGDNSFVTTGKASSLLEQPVYSQLGATLRTSRTARDADVGHRVAECPPRRAEMEPPLCARQVEAWWPYGKPRPPLRLPLRISPPRRARAV